MEFAQVRSKCIDKLATAITLLDEWSTTIKTLENSFKHLESHLEIFFRGENPVAYQTTVKWSGYSLYAFLKMFEDANDIVASLATFNPKNMSFEQYVTYASFWTSKASASTKPICEVIERAMRKLVYYGEIRRSPYQAEFTELCQLIEAIRFSLTDCTTAVFILRRTGRSLQNGTPPASFDNPVYYTLVTHVLPAICKTTDQLFNRQKSVDGLSSISKEIQGMLEYECNLFDMHTSARYYLMDLDKCYTVINSAAEKLSLTANAQTAFRRLLRVVTLLISATEYYEQSLKSGRVELFALLNGPTYADYRTIREVMLLLGRTNGSLESKIAEASEAARKNPNLRRIAGEVIHLCDLRSSPDLGNDSRSAAYQFWMAFISWIRALSSRLQMVQDIAKLSNTSTEPLSDGTSSTTTSLVSANMQVVEAKAPCPSNTQADCWADRILC